MIEWYKNRYIECDGVLEKTIRYRQVVGLLSASSINAFRSQGFSSAPETAADTRVTSNGAETDETTNPAGSSEVNSPEKAHCHVAVKKRRRRHENQLVALDVAYYLFHNNNHQASKVKNNQPSLSSLKQSQMPNKFLLQLHYHHPGYVPARLWQGFMAWEQQLCGARPSTCDETKETTMTTTPQDSMHGTSPHPSLQFIPVCFDCGGIVQPGIQNTSIRLVRNDPLAATRTQRRRESRHKAATSKKQHQSIKQHVKGSVTPNQLPHSRSKIWQYIWQQQNKYYDHSEPSRDLRKVYPFMNCCKNYYIVTCGSCTAQIYLPGLATTTALTNDDKEKKRGWSSKIPSAEPKKFPTDSTDSVAPPCIAMESPSEVPPMEKKVPVRSASTSRSDANPRKRQWDATASMSNAMSLNDRKKKKKPAKSTELMKFLSSLNDGTG